MNRIEDRIRAAAHVAADNVPADALPPLRLPAERTRPGWSPSGWSPSGWFWPGWLAPLAAAVAVVALVAAVVGIGRTLREPAVGPSAGASAPGGMVAGPPVSSYVASGQIPPYYVAITSHGNPNFNRSYAVVRQTASGKALATIQATQDDSAIVAVTAAADDRTFVLDEQPWATPNTSANQSYEARTFYMFRLDASGQPGPLTRLSTAVPKGEMLTGLALSPDGRKLALAVQPSSAEETRIMVYTLATGAVQSWTGDGAIGFTADDARSLSWTADGRTLAFDWDGNGNGLHAGAWLLNLAARGSDLLTDSRQVMSKVGLGWYAYAPLTGATAIPTPTASSSSALILLGVAPVCQEDSIITPDGSAVICAAVASETTPARNNKGQPLRVERGTETEFREYPVTKGKAARLLGHWTFSHVGAFAADVLWSNASGSVLIGVIPNAGDGRVGVISGNAFTPLAAPAAPVSPDSGTW
jgi:hypothetical protein